MLICVWLGVTANKPIEGMLAGMLIGGVAWALSGWHDPYPWSRHEPVTHSAPSYQPMPQQGARPAAVARATRPEVVDEAAVQALVALGANRKGAIAALAYTQWRGASTEDRVLNALRANPPN